MYSANEELQTVIKCISYICIPCVQHVYYTCILLPM